MFVMQLKPFAILSQPCEKMAQTSFWSFPTQVSAMTNMKSAKKMSVTKSPACQELMRLSQVTPTQNSQELPKNQASMLNTLAWMIQMVKSTVLLSPWRVNTVITSASSTSIWSLKMANGQLLLAKRLFVKSIQNHL